MIKMFDYESRIICCHRQTGGFYLFTHLDVAKKSQPENWKSHNQDLIIFGSPSEFQKF